MAAACSVLLAAADAGATGKATPVAPNFSWTVAPRMTGDGVAATDVAAPTMARVTLNACPALAGSAEYLWSSPTPRSLARPTDRRPIDGPDPVPPTPKGIPCSTVVTVPVGRPSTITLRVRMASGTTTAARSKVILPRDYLIVSVGDSFASGEGVPDRRQTFDWAGFVKAGPGWADRACHRSAQAGPSLAAADLERSDSHSTVTYVHLACSGSVLSTERSFDRDRGGVLDKDRGADPCCDRTWSIPAQIDVLTTIAANRPIDALTVSGGGNDIGFVPFVMACAADVLNPFGRSCIDNSDFTDKVKAAVDSLPTTLDDLKKKLPVPLSKVYVTGYPDLLEGSWSAGLLLAGITPREARWASVNMLGRMNSQLALPRGWNYVDTARRFSGHGAAAGSNRWLNVFSDALINQGPIPPACSLSAIGAMSALGLPAVALLPCGASIVSWIGQNAGRFITKGILHPNAKGQRAIADALLESIRPRLQGYGG